NKGEKAKYEELLEQYQYDGMDTCAVDGMCATECPVDINTGDLIKRLRRENHSDTANKIALSVAKNFGAAESIAELGVKFGVGVNSVLGKSTMTKLTGAVKKVIPQFPLWSNQLVPAGSVRSEFPKQA